MITNYKELILSNKNSFNKSWSISLHNRNARTAQTVQLYLNPTKHEEFRRGVKNNSLLAACWKLITNSRDSFVGATNLIKLLAPSSFTEEDLRISIVQEIEENIFAC